MDGDQVGADDTQPAQPLQWAYAMALLALYDFVQRFMDMQVDWAGRVPRSAWRHARSCGR